MEVKQDPDAFMGKKLSVYSNEHTGKKYRKEIKRGPDGAFFSNKTTLPFVAESLLLMSFTSPTFDPKDSLKKCVGQKTDRMVLRVFFQNPH